MLARDAATALPRALASVPRGSPIFVLDAESRDATVALAASAGARVEIRPWAGFVAARRHALGRVETPWTFMLDTDEALDGALAAAVLGAPDEPQVAGYVVRRTTRLCGKPVRGCGWGEEPLLRLARTARARIEAHPASGGSAELHERLEVDGERRELAGVLEHDSYPTLASYREKFARYTSLEAAGRSATTATLVATAARALVRAPWLYLARGGVRDGWRGLFVAVASAAYPVAATWKARRRR